MPIQTARSCAWQEIKLDGRRRPGYISLYIRYGIKEELGKIWCRIAHRH